MTARTIIPATNPAARREPVICAMVEKAKRGQDTHPATRTGSSM